jgi:hypothetical protein
MEIFLKMKRLMLPNITPIKVVSKSVKSFSDVLLLHNSSAQSDSASRFSRTIHSKECFLKGIFVLVGNQESQKQPCNPSSVKRLQLIEGFQSDLLISLETQGERVPL